MPVKDPQELRRRRRRYEFEARRNRYAGNWERLVHAVFMRLAPRLRTRMRPGVVVVVGSVLVGSAVGAIYWALIELGVSPLVLGAVVTLVLWLLAAVGALFRRLSHSESGQAPPPPTSGGGFGGVREPRRPPPSPRESPVEVPEPTGNEE